MPLAPSRVRVALVLLAALGAAALTVVPASAAKRRQAKEPTAATEAAPTSEPQPDPAEAAAPEGGSEPAPLPPDADPCKAWADWVCGQVGEGAMTCDGVRATEDLLPDEACRVAWADRVHAKRVLIEMSKDCGTLLSRLCTDLGPATQTCAAVLESGQRFAPDQCHAMLKNYDQVLAELQLREFRQHPLPDDLQARLAAPDAPSFGPIDAKVTLVLFSDFECPFCARAAETVAAVLATFGQHLRLVYRQMPSPQHEHAELAARASLEAFAQGQFWPFHDRLFAPPEETSREELETIADELGLDLDAFRAALDSDAHRDEVARDVALGREARVEATPRLFINGRFQPDAGNTEAVFTAIQLALSQAAGGAAAATPEPAPSFDPDGDAGP